MEVLEEVMEVVEMEAVQAAVRVVVETAAAMEAAAKGVDPEPKKCR